RNCQLATRIERGRQIIDLQCGVELIERLDGAASAVAKGDVDRRATIERRERQGRAADAAGCGRARCCEGRRISGVAVETECCKRIARAGYREVGSRAGADLQRATAGD